MSCDSSMIYDDYDTHMMMSFMPMQSCFEVEGGLGRYTCMYGTMLWCMMHNTEVILPPFIGLEAVTANIIHQNTPCQIKP